MPPVEPTKSRSMLGTDEGTDDVSAIAPSMTTKASSAKTRAAAPVPSERFFRVKDGIQVPRESGGGNFFLPKGKVLSSRGFDIKRLETLGVNLEEVTSAPLAV